MVCICGTLWLFANRGSNGIIGAMSVRAARFVSCLFLSLTLIRPAFTATPVSAQTAAPASGAADDLTLHSVGAWGIDLADRDPAVNPGDDFFMSQNGAWFAKTALTPQTPFAAYWNDLRRLTPRRLAALLEDVSADKAAPPHSARGQAGAFFKAFMDERAVDAKGVTPLEPELRSVRAASTRVKVAFVMGAAAGPSANVAGIAAIPPNRAVFTLKVGQDQHDPARYAVYVGQGGLGLPGPEYYAEPQFADIRTAYEAYAARMLSLIGWANPRQRAKQIVALETRIATVSWSHQQMRDVAKTYNRMSVAELSRFAPGFDWRAFLAGAELPAAGDVVIDAKSAFPQIARIVAETPLDVLQARQAFVIVDDAAPNLDATTAAAHFDFRFKAFNGSAVSRPRRILAWYTLEGSIGDLLGELYVERYFSPAARDKALEMSANIKRAFDARLAASAWMSPETRARARAKLAKMNVNIGYPDHVPDYRGLRISADDLYGDVVRASAFRWRRDVHRLNRPFDRGDWTFTPQMVNYSYIPTSNTLEIPAATLQPPFFDLHADEAVNYGSVGALIGSMVVSGFDNTGRHFDADGRQRDVLTAAEAGRFEAMTKTVADQYSAIEPLPGVHVKGELVADEAVDDIGGLLVALDAYHLSLHRRPAPVLDGFTGDQRLFLGRAQMWRAKFDAAFVRTQLALGNNAQPFLRVNGPVRNIDAWYAAFNIGPGDKMYVAPDQRIHIW